MPAEYGKSQAVFLSEESTKEDTTMASEGDGTLLNKSNSKTKRASRSKPFKSSHFLYVLPQIQPH